MELDFINWLSLVLQPYSWVAPCSDTRERDQSYSGGSLFQAGVGLQKQHCHSTVQFVVGTESECPTSDLLSFESFASSSVFPAHRRASPLSWV